jgi:regulator of sirC expression with transglutaminase-like and TPR domain
VDPTAAFVELVRGQDEAVPLARAALLIAAHAYPDLDVDRELLVFDELAAGCAGGDLDEWHDRLFRELAFTGNTVDYHDPRNSFLNEVVHRRLGIPITLAIVGIEVGRRLGLHLTGIGMPGHFLLQDKVDRGVFIDPFGGRILDREGCRRRFHDVAGADAAWSDDYLRPVGNVSILARLLNNLRAIYEGRREVGNLRWVMALRAVLPPPYGDSPGEFARSMAPLN